MPHAGQLILLPTSATAFLNEGVEFMCKIELPGFIQWEVNGMTNSSFFTARNINFTFLRTPSSETSTMSIAATIANNNSEIVCITVSRAQTEIARSPAVYLYIQGKLNTEYTCSRDAIVNSIHLILYRDTWTTARCQHYLCNTLNYSFPVDPTIFTKKWQQNRLWSCNHKCCHQWSDIWHYNWTWLYFSPPWLYTLW